MGNVLVIMADELAREGVGCYGHSHVFTPHMDRLAARGMRYTNAYTPSPVCVPARASFATGMHVAQTRCWSSAEAYHGQFPSWAHALAEAGHEVSSIGKLHFRSADDDNGFANEIRALHIRAGVGFTHGLLRRERDLFDAAHFAEEIGPGDDPYTRYDIGVADDAVKWLRRPSGSRPWALFVSFLRPHYPLTCPPEFFGLYHPARLPVRKTDRLGAASRHPVLAAFRAYYNYDEAFPDEHARQVARASYFGLCSFVDHQIGRVLTALEQSGHARDTTVLMTSDHGELNGAHDLWTKMTMHEESVAVPLILSGPGIAAGQCDAPASLIDAYPTILRAAGIEDTRAVERPGIALQNLAEDPLAHAERAIVSEYHDAGSITGFFMIRKGRFKYVCYPGFAPQLFDLTADPEEHHDLGLDPAYAQARADCHAALCGELGDPAELNELAFSDQAAVIERLGGVGAILAESQFDFTRVEA
ncbi:MAG: sulfatase-like hydrolase/transferase [Pseudomonadota bacterium]